VQEQLCLRMFLSWSAIVRYAVISAVNLAILLVGIAIGVMVAPHIEKTVSASPPQSAQQVASPTESHPTSATAEVSVQYEEISPIFSAGSGAVDTFLAHRIATDQLMANGYDVMVLNEGIINLLKNKGIATYRDLDAVVERAKIPHPLRVKVPTQPGPQPSKTEDKKP